MLTVKLFNTGYCSALEKLAMRTAPWRCCQFPALFALIQHPEHGNILFDTGHTRRFFELTKQFPMKIYRWLVRVEHDEKSGAVQQLKDMNISPEEINYIIISHFHADHIGALRDFPNAKFIYKKSAYDSVKDLKGFSALRAGFLSDLIPENFLQRSILLENQVSLPNQYAPFTHGHALFSDKKMIIVDLPGHAEGQIGLFVQADNETLFFAADACWASRAYLNLIVPHFLSFLVMGHKKQYVQTLKQLHQLNLQSPDIKIIPSHCQEVWSQYCAHQSI